jgi:ribose 5-phosphate isomerase B
MKIGIAADHAGMNYFRILIDELTSRGYQIVDLLGDRIIDDYPDTAALVASGIMHKTIDRGIVICGSGVGVSIAANKYPGIRAAVCHEVYSARQGVEHDNMNVLCIGERVIGPALVTNIAEAFINAQFHAEEERYYRRSKKVEFMENRKILMI